MSVIILRSGKFNRGPTHFEVEMAMASGFSPNMVRFYACRMVEELLAGRQLTPSEQMTLYTKVHIPHDRMHRPRES
jgi:hypothetical protein